jgi:lysozyme
MHVKSFRKKDRYGNEMAVEFFEVPEMQIPIYDHPGDPKGPDTVPAWLTPGEYVVNAEAVRMFEPQIEAMNEVGKDIQEMQGGTIPEGGMMPDQPVYANEGGNILKNFLMRDDIEGFSSNPYEDSGGYAIGFGSTQGIDANTAPISREEAEELLAKDMGVAQDAYGRLVTADLNPNQAAAVQSLIYNVGQGNFGESEALKRLNEGDFEGYLNEASEFRLANGEVMPGLVNRREQEAILFNTPYETAAGTKEETSSIADRILAMLNPISTANAQTTQVPPSQSVPVQEEEEVGPNGLTADQLQTLMTYPSPNERMDIVSGGAGNQFEGMNQTDIPVIEIAPDGELIPPLLQDQETGEPVTKGAVGQAEPGTAEADEPADLTFDDQTGTVVPSGETAADLGVGENKQPKEKTDVAPNDVLIDLINGTAGNDTPGAGDDVTGAGKAALQDKSIASSVIGFLTETLGEMISSKDVLKMAINYAGSRALGYNHEGSLNFAAKDYVERTERLVKAVQSNKAAYTGASYAKFMQTRNPDDLIPKSAKTKLGKMVYVPKFGLQQSIERDGVPYIMVDHDDNPNTPRQYVNAIELGAVVAKDSLHDAATIQQRFVDVIKRIENDVNSGRKNDRVQLDSAVVAGEAKDLYFKMLRQYGADPGNAGEVETALNRALDNWGKAMFRYRTTNEGDDPSRSFKAFFIAETITQTAGLSPTKFEGTDPQNLLSLHSYAERRLPTTEAYQAYWKKLEEVYFKAQSKARSTKDDSIMNGFVEGKQPDGWTPFTWWIHNFQLAGNDPNNAALQLFNEFK